MPTLILPLLLFTALCGHVLSQQPSQGPCNPTCPPEDLITEPVGPPPDYQDLTSDPIFCSYPSVPNQDPMDFYCTYSKTSGELVTDADNGLCQDTAPCTPSNRRRRNTQAQAPNVARELSADTLEMLKARRALASGKRNTVVEGARSKVEELV